MKIDRKIIGALDATGLPYEFVKGGKHIVVRLNGHHAGILPALRAIELWEEGFGE